MARGRDANLRAVLEQTLVEIDEIERKLPPASRFDVASLRRALRMGG